MMNNELERKGLPPPYGPTRGMIQGLQLLQRMTPAKIDSDFLRDNRVAPGNEYKVVGALRFLDLIDGEGRPTEKSRLLKTRGPTYTLALQELVRTAYSGIFKRLDPKEISRENIHNYFVTEADIGVEMAAKATRFFVELCRVAEIGLAPDSAGAQASRLKRGSRGRTSQRGWPSRRLMVKARTETPAPTNSSLPLVFAITPETAEMDTDHLTQLFRKMRIALERASSKDGE